MPDCFCFQTTEARKQIPQALAGCLFPTVTDSSFKRSLGPFCKESCHHSKNRNLCNVHLSKPLVSFLEESYGERTLWKNKEPVIKTSVGWSNLNAYVHSCLCELGTECLPTAPPTCCPHRKREQQKSSIYPIYPLKRMPGFT